MEKHQKSIEVMGKNPESHGKLIDIHGKVMENKMNHPKKWQPCYLCQNGNKLISALIIDYLNNCVKEVLVILGSRYQSYGTFFIIYFLVI